MKTIKYSLTIFISMFIMASCNNNSSKDQTNGAVGTDSTITNPTTNAEDYHNDQRQRVPMPDSSNTVGTDTISGSVSTPNTGTVKAYNEKKGNKDSMK